VRHSYPTGAANPGRGLFYYKEAASLLSFWEKATGPDYSVWCYYNLVYGFNTPLTYATWHFNFADAFAGAEDFRVFALNGAMHYVLGTAVNSARRQEIRDTQLVVAACDTSIGLPTVTMASTEDVRKYSRVSGAGIPASTTVESIDSATQITLSANATATATVALTFDLSGPTRRTGYVLNDVVQHTVAAAASLNRSVYTASANLEVNGTDPDNPEAWDPLNSLYAYSDVDRCVGIAKQLSTIAVFKETSTEFFRDAGTTPTPLARVEGLKLDVGLQDVNTLCEADDTIFWSARVKVGQRSVWAMTKLQAKEISNPSIRRFLTEHQDDEQYGMVFSLNGHTFYLISITGVPALVYDMTSGTWSYWTALGEVDWPFVDATNGSDGTVYLQHRSNGRVYRFDATVHEDDGERIDMDIYPPEFDGGTRKGKYLANMFINADQEPGSTLQLRVSDDNQQSWTDWRMFDLGHDRPRLEACGTFTKRVFHFRHSSPTACRLHEVELELDVGTL
jgi:hypothetical protein